MRFKIWIISALTFFCFSASFGVQAVYYIPPEIARYDRIIDFVHTEKCVPVMCWFNSFKMKNFLKIPKYINLINNDISAESLVYSEIQKNKELYGDDINVTDYSYIRYHRVLTSGEWILDFDDFDLNDVESGRAFFRVNIKENVIYTVRKTRGKLGAEYVFRAFRINMKDNEKNTARLALSSQCCVEQLPDMSYLKNGIQIGVTTLDEVKRNIPDTKFNARGEKGISTYACADKYGTIVYVRYAKDKDGIFRVENVEWTCSGYNVLPYLLPIDRQLIDLNYVPPVSEPGCTIL